MKNKTILPVFIFCLLSANLLAQNFWVPDSVFRNYIKTKHPTCFTAQDSLITNCSAIQNDTLIYLTQTNAKSLSGIEYFTHLRTLNCFNNKITSLVSLPDSLRYIECSYNNITFVDSLPLSLRHFKSTNNQIDSIIYIPSHLSYLNVAFNPGIFITNLPLSLRSFNCDGCSISVLPKMPIHLAYLNCSGNNIFSIDSLPNSLIGIYSNFCPNLSSISSLPDSLSALYCRSCNLSTISDLPQTLSTLDVSNNQLSHLPVQLNYLLKLYCENNRLTQLPVLPNNMHELYCNANQISSLPHLPGDLEVLDCSNNPISCLPDLPNVFWLNYQNTFITCAQSLPQGGPFSFTFDPSDATMCSPVGLQVCPPQSPVCNYGYTVGYVYLDSNGNGIKDSLEQGMFGLPITNSNGYTASSNAQGFFGISSDTGNITFQTTWAYHTLMTSLSLVAHVSANSIDTIYFGFQ